MDTFPFYHFDYIDMFAYLYDMLKEYEFGMEGEEDDEDEDYHQRLHVVSTRSRVTGY